MFIFSGCSKKRLENNSVTTTFSPLENYLNTRKQQEQTFEIDSPGTAPIVGQQGTVIYQSADIFMYPNSDSVHYPYYVGLIELYTPKDMIYYQMPTYGSGHLLTTGGEIHVRAYKDSTELILRPGKFYITYFPTSQIDSSMKVFHGTETGNIVDWSQSTDYISWYSDTSGYYYKTFISALNWINLAVNWCNRHWISSSSLT
jgi:hypothetical protein